MSRAMREAIRAALGMDADRADLRQRFLAAAGAGKEPDSRRDIARRHDEILYGGRS